MSTRAPHLSPHAAASRRNGACSRGPVTPAGKARSARNSRRHGLCSAEFVLEGRAEQQAFDMLLKDIVFSYRAVTPSQEEVCRHIAVAIWRRRVCDNLEAALLHAIERGEACAEHGGGGLPSLRTLTRYRARLARDLKEAELQLAGLHAARAQAFEKRMDVAREFANPTHLHALRQELGEAAFASFREDVTNEPELYEAKENRRERRRQEALSRKGTKG